MFSRTRSPRNWGGHESEGASLRRDIQRRTLRLVRQRRQGETGRSVHSALEALEKARPPDARESRWPNFSGHVRLGRPPWLSLPRWQAKARSSGGADSGSLHLGRRDAQKKSRSSPWAGTMGSAFRALLFSRNGEAGADLRRRQDDFPVGCVDRGRAARTGGSYQGGAAALRFPPAVPRPPHASWDGVIRIWDLKTGTSLASFKATSWE